MRVFGKQALWVPVVCVPLLLTWFPAAGEETSESAQAGGPGVESYRLTGVGFRVGPSADPDQVYGGVHWDIGSPHYHVRVRPNVELGTGDDQTLLAMNGEVDYFFRRQGVWSPYAGGAIGVNYTNYDDPPRPLRDDDDTELGFYGVGGLEQRLDAQRRFHLEAKLGFADSPDFKAGVGWTF